MINLPGLEPSGNMSLAVVAILDLATSRGIEEPVEVGDGEERLVMI